jgi:hypothetical protein
VQAAAARGVKNTIMNKEHIAKVAKAKYLRNREKYLAKYKEYYHNDPLKRRLYAKEYRRTHPQKIAQESRDNYRKSVKDLRKMFPVIEKREKNIIIYNSGVEFINISEDGKEVIIDEQNTKKAYEKLDSYLKKVFGDDWVDNPDVISYLKNIKVNFSADNKIKARMMNSDRFLQKDNDRKNPLFAEVPSYVEDYIKSFKDDENFKRSSLFQSLLAPYNGLGSTNSTVYMNISNKKEEDENDTKDTE